MGSARDNPRDAIQIAVGILYGATHFLTNDPNLEKISEIKVLVLDDYLP